MGRGMGGVGRGLEECMGEWGSVLGCREGERNCGKRYGGVGGGVGKCVGR